MLGVQGVPFSELVCQWESPAGWASQNEVFDVTDPYRVAERGGAPCPTSRVSTEDCTAHDTSKFSTLLLSKSFQWTSSPMFRALLWGGTSWDDL